MSNKLVLSYDKFDALNVLSQQTNEVVIITDKYGVIEWVNDGFEHLTKFSFEEAVGQKPGDLLQGTDTDPQTIKNIAQALREQKPIKTDILNYTKYGHSYWLRLFIRPVFNKSFELTGFVATEIDLTDQYNMREKLIDTNIQLTKTIEEKDFFIGVLSHDIKNTIGSISSLSSILKENGDQFDGDKIKKYATLINNTSNITLNTLKNIVEISKQNTEQYQTENLNKILLSCLQNLYILYTMKKINVLNKIENDVFLETVSINLEVILNNILSNSIKYTPENGSITIEYKNDNTNHNIIIIDDGIGMTESQIKDFNETINDSYSTGFGLYICKELTQKMKGELNIRNRNSSGTVVTVKLPIKLDN